MFSYLKHRLYFYTLLPRRGGSNDYPQSMFLSQKKKKKRSILLAVINIYRTCVF